jgi:transposase
VARATAQHGSPLNGLGTFSAPLYLFPKFFEGKATEHLIGEGIQPEHLGERFICLGFLSEMAANRRSPKQSQTRDRTGFGY